MRELLRIVNELQSDNSKSGKERIIKSNLDNKLFVEVMQFILNPYVLSGLSEKKASKQILHAKVEYEIVNDLIGMMEYLRINNTGKDFDICVVQSFLDTITNSEEKELAKQVITKSLKVGIDSLWNKSVPNEFQVPEFGCMLAKSLDDNENKLNGTFIISKKLDGNRCIIVKENGVSKALTRTGNLYDGLEYLLEEVDSVDYLDNVVLDGELIADSDGTNNEIFAETQSLARSKGKNKVGLKFHIFDMIPLDEFKNGQSIESAIKRKQNVNRLCNDIDFKHIEEVSCLYIGTDKDAITAYMKEKVEPLGWEGLIVNLDKPYVTKRTDALLKVKKFKSCDVEIIGFEEGTGKYVGKLGALIVDYKGSPCGIGTGLSDSDRFHIWNNQDKWLNRIVECKFFEESVDNRSGNVSMRFPVFVRLREIGKEVSYN